MIEVIIKQFLSENLSVPVYMEEPESAPARFVLLDKTGSSKVNRSLSSTFAFQSYAESMYEAAVLNEQVKQAVESMVSLAKIGSVRLNSDYNFTDTETKRYRYQAVYDISHY